MRKSKYSEHQIIRVIKEFESGVPVKEVCRGLGISVATFCQLGSKYSGMEASDLKRLKELEEENRRLKQMYADLSLDDAIVKDIVQKSCNPSAAQGTGRVCD